MSTSWKRYRKSQRITKVVQIHPHDCHHHDGNQSRSCWGIEVGIRIKVVNYQNNRQYSNKEPPVRIKTFFKKTSSHESKRTPLHLTVEEISPVCHTGMHLSIFSQTRCKRTLSCRRRLWQGIMKEQRSVPPVGTRHGVTVCKQHQALRLETSPHLFLTFQGSDLLKLTKLCVKGRSTDSGKLDHAVTECVAHINITVRKRIVNWVTIAFVACHFPWTAWHVHSIKATPGWLGQEVEFGLSPLTSEAWSALHLFFRWRSKKVKSRQRARGADVQHQNTDSKHQQSASFSHTHTHSTHDSCHIAINHHILSPTSPDTNTQR